MRIVCSSLLAAVLALGAGCGDDEISPSTGGTDPVTTPSTIASDTSDA